MWTRPRSLRWPGRGITQPRTHLFYHPCCQARTSIVTSKPVDGISLLQLSSVRLLAGNRSRLWKWMPPTHCSGSGRKINFGYQSKFQQNTLVWCPDYHKIQKRKKCAGGPSLRNFRFYFPSLESSVYTVSFYEAKTYNWLIEGWFQERSKGFPFYYMLMDNMLIIHKIVLKSVNHCATADCFFLL